MKSRIILLVFLLLPVPASAEPIVITGKMIPAFLGKNIVDLRVTNHAGACIPFQIDQVDSADYVCPNGKEPNKGSGMLDTADEIVFLWEDADTGGPSQRIKSTGETAKVKGRTCVTIGHGSEDRFVYITDNPSIPLSPVSYIDYDNAKELITTPYFYANFGHDRFHFTHAGVKNFSTNSYLNLTNELRIRIILKALWGILPITYSEDNMVCLVKRYKAGPIRLIRRGDFHLNLGLFFEGSHAAVNQICYPQLVRVPVYIHLPMKFRTLFKVAYIEMSPVFRQEAADFSFDVASCGISFPLGSARRLDTLVEANPNHTCMTAHNGLLGYGWVLDADIDNRLLSGSGYRVTMPSDRGGIGQCGFRLTVRDLPKGYYLIGNWVLFSGSDAAGLLDACDRISSMASVAVEGTTTMYCNQLGKVTAFRKR
jgi:hypothetical protein